MYSVSSPTGFADVIHEEVLYVNKNAGWLCQSGKKNMISPMSTITAVVGYLLIVLNLIAVITVIFFKRNEPSTRFAWLLVLTFMPVVGFFIYLLFGHPRIRKEKLKLSEDTAQEVLGYITNQENMLSAASELDDNGDLNFTRLIYLNLVNDKAMLTDDNTIRIYTNGAEKFKDLISDIQKAEKYIHLLYFIFRTDTIGTKIINLLAQKAAEGVEIRVIYDDIGSLTIRDKDFDPIRKAGGIVYRYSPVLPAVFSANYRNHRKLVTVDGDVGYIGGMNIGDEYIHGRKKLKPWRDTHLRVVGSAIHLIELLFLKDFSYAADRADQIKNMRKYFDLDRKFDGSSMMQIVSSMPADGGDHLRTAYMKMISMAEKYLYIQTPYLVLDKGMYDLLKMAASSGVDVRIMLPEFPDKSFVYYATLSFARRLLRKGVKIYLYKGFLHSKMLVCDDKALSIGSANMDIRSFSLSFEANAFIYSYMQIADQRDQFFADMANSQRINEDYFRQMNPVKKALMPVFEMLSPLL